MEKHEAWTDLLHENRDVAVAATTGHIPGIRHRVQHAWRYAWWTVLQVGKKVHERLSK